MRTRGADAHQFRGGFAGLGCRFVVAPRWGGLGIVVSKRNSKPVVVDEQGAVRKLRSATGVWSEDQLQEFLFAHPGVLPVELIEPFFAPLVPLAREVRLKSGRLDLLYANASGLLTLVECKLWKNEEARRSVIGQLLEYANDTSRLGFTELQEAVARARNEPNFDLVDHMRERVEDLDEVELVDAVNRNLRLGRFLLLIVGDGIRERMEGVAAYLQAHAYLNFTFSLVQMALFDLPGFGVLVQPSILLRTLEVERAVVRLEGERLTAQASDSTVQEGGAGGVAASKPRRRTQSLQIYLDELAVETDASVAERLKQFLDRATDLGLEIDYGRGTVILRFERDGVSMNFGIFRPDGTFENKGAANVTGANGEPIGMSYVDGLAGLFGGSVTTKSNNPWHYAVRTMDGSRLQIEQLLDWEGDVLRLMERAVGELEDAAEA